MTGSSQQLVFAVQVDDILWFCGSVNNMLFVAKIPGLQSVQANQISKLKTDLLYRNVVQASAAPSLPSRPPPSRTLYCVRQSFYCVPQR